MALVLNLANAQVAAATAANCTLGNPASMANGDLLIALIHVEDGVTIDVVPAGWELIASISHGVVAMQNLVYWKTASGEPSTWTWEHASTWRAGWVQRITGAPATNPIDGTPSTGTGTSLTLSCPSITTLQNNSALVLTRGSFVAKTQGTLSSPLVERIEYSYIGMASGIQASAGASGAKTMGISTAGSDEWVGILFAIKDAAETPGAFVEQLDPLAILARM